MISCASFCRSSLDPLGMRNASLVAPLPVRPRSRPAKTRELIAVPVVRISPLAVECSAVYASVSENGRGQRCGRVAVIVVAKCRVSVIVIGIVGVGVGVGIDVCADGGADVVRNMGSPVLRRKNSRSLVRFLAVRGWCAVGLLLLGLLRWLHVSLAAGFVVVVGHGCCRASGLGTRRATMGRFRV